MKKIKPLHYKLLRQKLNASQLAFKTTNEIKSFTEFVGQERALEALNFGIDIHNAGYNLYAMGPSGIGKYSFVKKVLDEHAKKRSTPSDWCYIHNFNTPEKPIALRLPAGIGLKLQKDMNLFISELSANITTIFESDEYIVKMKKIVEYYDAKREKLNKRKNNSKIDKTPQLYKKQHEKEKEFQMQSTAAVVKPIINELKKKYAKISCIIDYLTAIQNDIINNVNDFIKQDEKTNLLTFSLENPALTKYKVNLLTDHSKSKGAPVVFEEAPSYTTLICRVEYAIQHGASVTNFTLIKPGALHRANGGYLIIEAKKIKKDKEAWDALKRALFAKEIKIKPIDHEIDPVKPISLEPTPIPLNVKVVLLGDRNTYYSLSQNDSDFSELFKVAVDFDEQIERNNKNIQHYAKLIGTIAKREKTRPFHASAVASIIDHSSRLAEDADKLTTFIRDIRDLILEANYWANLANKKIVMGIHVQQAINAQINRMSRSRDLYYEDIFRHFIIIRTNGKSIAQVNCLSVRRVGQFSYGHPTRVTARVRLGKGKIIDIQREIKLAGPLHSKASLIISHFLSSRFNPDKPFALSASIAFEQIYGWTDGDSASVGELCALLSALAKIPILQNFAVTGAIDQYGRVQAVGGINEKIEGFFDICKARGLHGNQGVILPAVNVKNLMLREDIVEAVKTKQFFIYTITTIDQAVLLLTGLEAGKRDQQGKFPQDTLYDKIEKRLNQFARNKKKLESKD